MGRFGHNSSYPLPAVVTLKVKIIWKLSLHANSEQISQSRPDSGLGLCHFQCERLEYDSSCCLPAVVNIERNLARFFTRFVGYSRTPPQVGAPFEQASERASGREREREREKEIEREGEKEVDREGGGERERER